MNNNMTLEQLKAILSNIEAYTERFENEKFLTLTNNKIIYNKVAYILNKKNATWIIKECYSKITDICEYTEFCREVNTLCDE